MKSRIIQGLRLLVCLVLICCFLVNSSPIKAKAGLVEGLISAPLPVEAKVVAGAILVCLGIMAASDLTAFNNAVDNFVNFLTESTSYVVDGMINVFGVVGSDGLVRSYLPQDLVETGLGWAFDSGVVSPAPSVSYEANSSATLVPFTSFNGEDFTATVSNTQSYYVHALVSVASNGHYQVKIYFLSHVAGAKYYVTSSLHGTARECKSTQHDSSSYYYRLVTGDVSSLSDIHVPYTLSSSISDLFANENDSFAVADGLTLGLIQAPADEVAFGDLEAYSGYASGAIAIPGTSDDDEIAVPMPHLPVRIPGLEYNDDVTTQTQEEAQTGVTDLEFEFTGDDVVTDDTVTDGAATDSGAITSGIKDFFDFAPEDLVLPASLTDLFPFCIPKDIYDLVTIFNAEPEAPHFVFDVPFPYMEEPWHIDIDFAVWDSAALVLRRLELLLFVVGLAMATRNYYIRG